MESSSLNVEDVLRRIRSMDLSDTSSCDSPPPRYDSESSSSSAFTSPKKSPIGSPRITNRERDLIRNLNTKYNIGTQCLEDIVPCLEKHRFVPGKVFCDKVSELEEKISSLEDLLKQSETKNHVLEQSNAVLKKAVAEINENFQKSMKNKKEEMPEQPKTIIKTEVVVDDSSQYETLAFICKEATPVLGEQVNKIKADASKTPQERVETVLGLVINQVAKSEHEKVELQKKIECANKKLAELQQNNERTLSIFEEELKFFEKLTKSSDIQNLLFNSQQFTEDDISELKRRCMKHRNFIETQLSLYDSVYKESTPTHIFDLLIPNLFAEKISNCTELFDQDITNKQLFYLFYSQALVTDIIQSYALETQNLLASQRAENSRLEQELIKAARDAEEREECALVAVERLKKRLIREKEKAQQKIEEVERRRKVDLQRSSSVDVSISPVIIPKVSTEVQFDSITQEVSSQLTHLNTLISEKETEIKTIRKQHEEELSSIRSESAKCMDEIEKIKTIYEKKVTLLMEKRNRQKAKSIERARILKSRIEELEELNITSVQELKKRAKIIREDHQSTYQELIDMKKKCERLSKELSNEKNKVITLKGEKEDISVEIQSHTSRISMLEQEITTLTEQNEEQIKAIREECNNLIQNNEAEFKRKEDIYMKALDELNALKKLLRLPPGNDLLEELETILKEKDRLQTELATLTTQKATEKPTLRVDTNQAARLKQWQIWASRVNSIVKNTQSTHLADDELRLSLEELLLSGSHNRKLLSKVQILKDEKSILTKYRSYLDNPNKRRPIRMKSLILMIVAIRRLQALSNTLPITI